MSNYITEMKGFCSDFSEDIEEKSAYERTGQAISSAIGGGVGGGVLGGVGGAFGDEESSWRGFKRGAKEGAKYGAAGGAIGGAIANPKQLRKFSKTQKQEDITNSIKAGSLVGVGGELVGGVQGFRRAKRESERDKEQKGYFGSGFLGDDLNSCFD